MKSKRRARVVGVGKVMCPYCLQVKDAFDTEIEFYCPECKLKSVLPTIGDHGGE